MIKKVLLSIVSCSIMFCVAENSYGYETLENDPKNQGGQAAGRYSSVTRISAEETIDKTGALIEWTSSNEDEVHVYMIERAGPDLNFVTIESIQVTGDESLYLVMDSDPMDGFNYYRVKELDIIGDSAFSEVVRYYKEPERREEKPEVYPNPVSKVGKQTLRLIGGNDIQTFKVINVHGNVLYQGEINPLTRAIDIPEGTLKDCKNILFLEITSAIETKILKVLVQ